MTQRSRKFVNLFLMCALLTGTLFGVFASSSPMVRVIVQGESLDAAVTAVHASGGRVDSEISLIEAVVADIPQHQLSHLLTSPGVTNVTRDRELELAGGQVDVEFSETVGLSEVWETGNLGQGVTVAIMDSGIDPSFNGLRHSADGDNNRLVAYYDAIGDELYEGQDIRHSPGDPNGHGTHIAGIIANSTYEQQEGQYRGVAPAADLISVRVLNREGVGAYSDVLRGVSWVVENKDAYEIDVLNLSLFAIPIAPYWVDPYNQIVMAAWQAGIVVVTSAGNAGPGPMSIGVPGNTPYVITVGTFTDHYTPDDYSDDYIPPFSSAGPTFDGFVKPDVIAPGAHMDSLMHQTAYVREEYPDNSINGRYFSSSGTSTSAAVVSGIAALMLSENPDLTPDQIKYRLAMTARPQLDEITGEAAYSIWQQGAGRVWAPDAVFTDMEGEANVGMDIELDLNGDEHYWGWTIYDVDAQEFRINGYSAWSDGYTNWAGGYSAWSDGYSAWSDMTNWGGSFYSWADGYSAWSDGYSAWSDGYSAWSDGYSAWSDGYSAWSDAYLSWVGGYSAWSDGYSAWSDGYSAWSDGYSAWSDGYSAWSDGYSSWSDGYSSWSDGYSSWSDAYSSWSDGYSSWSDGYSSWSDAYSSWSGGYSSWSGGIPEVDW